MTVIGEGNKNSIGLTRNCQAVSELIGQIFMLAVVVLAFSSIALTVFSDGGTRGTTHTPHTNLLENIDMSGDTVQIFHTGGEAIDFEDIKIILSVNGTQAEYNISDPNVKVFDPEGNQSSDDFFMLGDYILIDPGSKINITDGEALDLYFVHTESNQVIQKTTLWREVRDFPYWITPHTFPEGTAYNNYTQEWLDTELVDKIDDELATDTLFPKQEWISERFTFGIDTGELGIPESTSFTEVLLKFVYKKEDNSAHMKLEINNGSQWITIKDPLPRCKTFTDCVEEGYDTYNITEHVKTTAELEKLTVRISYYENAAPPSEKTGWVDFAGVHVGY